jgi:hypothetical protein
MKKEYRKPQVVEVKLTLQNPIMGDCNIGSASLAYPDPYCSQSTGTCAFP